MSGEEIKQPDLNRLMRPPMVCLCKSVPEREIRSAIKEKGAQSFEEVQKITQCSTGCGTCETRVRDLITKILLE